VYVVNRALGGKIKVSIHETGTSQVSFLNDDIAAEWSEPGASRHLDRWYRGPEFAHGWTRMFEVIMPGVEMRHFKEPGMTGRVHQPLPTPADEAAHVLLLAGRPGPAAATLGLPNGAVLARGPLDAETELVIVAMHSPWGPELAAGVKKRAPGRRAVARGRRPGSGGSLGGDTACYVGLGHRRHALVIDAAGYTAARGDP
jgi:hypothetical protein